MTYKICVSIAEKTPKKLDLVLKKTLKKSDYAELRFDFLKPIQIPDALELVKKKMRRCVCTLRPSSEGGKFQGTEKERISILKLIAEYHPFLLDVEFETIAKNKNLHNYIKKTKTDVLVSWHDFKKTPDSSSLKKRLKQMRKFSKYIKIVTSAKNQNDSSNILSLYNVSKNTNLIAFAMGDYGKTSRILCLYLGSPFTYASLGKPIAPGQFSIDQIKKIVKARKK
ncbi:MAG TPA: type I 3-dehydroquinate dehydratase [Nitrosopumilaceae archaeon]|nr:type I 3-dehydroquinate dehydratase [Nitrosopumilaceae archaeon]